MVHKFGDKVFCPWFELIKSNPRIYSIIYYDKVSTYTIKILFKSATSLFNYSLQSALPWSNRSMNVGSLFHSVCMCFFSESRLMCWMAPIFTIKMPHMAHITAQFLHEIDAYRKASQLLLAQTLWSGDEWIEHHIWCLSMYSRWLIWCPTLILYPTCDSLKRWLREFITRQKRRGEIVSPWYIPLWIFALPIFFSHRVRLVSQYFFEFSMNFLILSLTLYILKYPCNRSST